MSATTPSMAVLEVVLHALKESSGRSSLIGVAISLTGNVLISLALNCQKLAHIRLQREAQGLDVNFGYSDDEANGYEAEEATSGTADAPPSPSKSRSQTSSRRNSPPPSQRRKRVQRRGSASSVQQSGNEETSEESGKAGMSTDFLRSRLWWLGIGLMTLGEFGNFLSYGFAPASLVAPLGAVALLANVVFAPIMLKERFRAADLGGIFLAILGAVTVVFSSKQSDATLDPDQLLQAISQKPFITYVAITVALMIVLIWASTTALGDRYILLDVGVCALFGGFTVLSTKGLSSLLSQGQPLELIRYPITYALLAVLVSTALAQVTYLNRALQRFDSREVIPTQFVTFTISAIVGSAILYQDFANMDVHRLINFLFGCSTTFAGVYFLTRTRHNEEDDDDETDEEAAYEEGEEHVDVATNGDGESEPLLGSPRKPRRQAISLAVPVAVPRTHPAAVNQARRNKRRLRSRASLISLGTASGSTPNAALSRGRGPGAGLSTSLQDLTHTPIVIARRSIFNPALTTITYVDASAARRPPTRP